ncbi:MAG: fatty acid desaturase [Actinomycetota bacterium]|nr:fatty acid desaturase [Actinomycetota bacterium]
MTQALESPPPARATDVQGVIELDHREATFQRRAVLILTILPFAGVFGAIALFWGTGLSAVTAAIAFVFYVFSGMGVTVGFHRLFTHKSFEASRGLKLALAIGGSFAVQGSVLSWVAAHRRHHAYSDREGDPHSPHLDEGPGLRGVVRGLWHAHIGWLTSPEKTDIERWAPDLLKDPDLVKIDRWFPRLSVLSFTLPALIGVAVTRSLWGGIAAFIWGSLVRVFFLHHVTWSINSICHFYGERPFKSLDFSTNNWVLAIISFGESWHNNHHAFPTSARHGIGRGQIDVSAGLISLFEKLHLATKVKIVKPKQLAAKAIRDFKPRRGIMENN